MKFLKYIIFLLLLVGIGFLVFKKVYIPKHTFSLIKAKKGDMKIVVNGIGNVGARNLYLVGSEFGGKVLDFHIKEGDHINKGDLVAHIDSVDLQDKINEQKALKEKLLSDIETLKIDAKNAEVNYRYQNELYIKNKKLYKLHSLSYLEYQKYLTQKESAALQIKSIQSKIISLKNQIKQIDANINGLQKRLERYTIVSPISGYVVKKFIANYQSIPPNQPIIEVVAPKDVWVRAFIDTRISGKVKVGDRATFKLRSSEKLLKGKVVQINPINNPITYEREIDIAYDNLPIPFYLEEQASVKIDAGVLRNVLKIPSKALSFYNEKTGLWILKNNKAYFEPVKVLAYEGSTVAIEGIDETSKIIIPDPKKKALKNGMKIYHD